MKGRNGRKEKEWKDCALHRLHSNLFDTENTFPHLIAFLCWIGVCNRRALSQTCVDEYVGHCAHRHLPGHVAISSPVRTE